MSMDIETARELCRSMIPGIEQISRQFEAALNGLESVAALTAQDAEQLLREGKELAAASTLTERSFTMSVLQIQDIPERPPALDR